MESYNTIIKYLVGICQPHINMVGSLKNIMLWGMKYFDQIKSWWGNKRFGVCDVSIKSSNMDEGL